MQKYDLAIAIGRFQPLHVGHLYNFKKAKELAHEVLILVGSSFQPRTIKNPFTFKEREIMIDSALEDTYKNNYPYVDRFHIEPIRDFFYEEIKWVKQVQQVVAEKLVEIGKPDGKVCIIGYEKDESSYYLRMFPCWHFNDIGSFQEVGERPVDATKIRELLFNNHYPMMKGVVPTTTYTFLVKEFIHTDEFQNLINEYNFIKDYKQQWSVAPYPPTFNCTDAVVIQGGHILLIKRKAAPGSGLWALPGGFLDQSETCEEGVLRELREETRLKVPLPILKANITFTKRFDYPDRSLRGRTITEAFLIELAGPVDGKLPKVKGADDAAEARWFPINDALNMSEVLFEDHHSIISMLSSRAK